MARLLVQSYHFVRGICELYQQTYKKALVMVLSVCLAPLFMRDFPFNIWLAYIAHIYCIRAM